MAGLIAIAAVGAVVAAQFSAQVHERLDRPDASAAYVAAVGRAASATLQTHPPAGFSPSERPEVHRTLTHASVSSYRLAMVLAAVLAFLSGILSLVGIERVRQPA